MRELHPLDSEDMKFLAVSENFQKRINVIIIEIWNLKIVE